MKTRRTRFAPDAAFAVETLERREVMTALPHAAAIVEAQFVRAAATKTIVTATAGTLGAPVTISVTERTSASAGAPTGTVNILDHGQVIATLALAPSATNGRFATSTASVTLAQPPGGVAYWFGKHQITATYAPQGSFAKSTAVKTFNVAHPSYTSLADGVKVATVIPGSGASIASGQTASVVYTGYLSKNGTVFDDSIDHGGAPFNFTLGASQVIDGFDAGTVGMKVGETRAILIPAAEGYGSSSTGSIPANSSLLFLVTLESIS